MIDVRHGDSREVLKTFADASIDSCVTDPPYALVSIVKRFGADNAAAAKSNGASGVYKRASAGFMGQKWDTGETAFDPDFWAEVWRVLKPGAHLLAFSGTRTYHRMVCAIEDAGFEIRDQIMWVYGSGFPKSMDVSKAIDKLDATEMRRARQLRFTEWMRATGLTSARIDEITGTNMGGHYTTAASQPAVATREHFEKLRPFFPAEVPAWVEAMVDERTVESLNFQKREFFDTPTGGLHGGSGNTVGSFTGRQAKPGGVTEAARAWEGWGTALKPAHEPIVVARKPLAAKTVAANVLAHGTGALNIDGCRVAYESDSDKAAALSGDAFKRKNTSDKGWSRPWMEDSEKVSAMNAASKERAQAGRWPANLVLSYPADEYQLRDDVTAEQTRELYGWLHENA